MIYHLPPGVPRATLTPPKARLVGWTEVQKDNLLKGPQAIRTAWCALDHGHSKDHMLARLDDTTRSLGVWGIATLGSLGVNQPGAALPLWLGGASWLGAMAITPQVINGMIRLKTGVNLGTRYMSSNGDIRPLFQDPSYLVMHVIPVKTRIKLARKFGIPLDHPDGLELLQEKLKQVAVQGHTWWMLMAGMATPVLASLICDRLEDPAKGLVSQLRVAHIRHNLLNPALASKNPADLTRAVEAMAKTVMGSGTEITPMARWWKQLPKEMIKALNLNTMSQADLLHPSHEMRFERLLDHLHAQFRQPDVRHNLNAVIAQRQKQLHSIISPLETLLRRQDVETLLPRKTLTQLQEQVQLVRDTAEATLQHFRQLLLLGNKGQLSRGLLREQMEKSVLAYLEQAVKHGSLSQGHRLAGGVDQFNKVIKTFSQERFGPAFVQMGDSPKSFLLKALNSAGLRRRWYTRFPGILGIGMLAATAIYVACFVGRDFGGSLPQQPGGQRS